MADIIEGQQQQPDTSAQEAAYKAELATHMAQSLGQQYVPDIPAQAADPALTTQPQPDAQPAAAATTVVVDRFGGLSEKFGFATPEDAIAEIEKLRGTSADPFASINFENDESAAIMRALSAGKFDEVRSHLNRNHELQNLVGLEVNKDTAANIVKYGMQLKYPFLSPDEINYQFNKQFSFPQKPVQSADEEQTDYDDRLSQWNEQVNDKTMSLMIEAKMVKPEIDKAKTSLKFPNIEPQVDEGYAQYRQMLAEEEKLHQQAQAAYKAFTPEQLKTKLPFNDEPNKINFEFEYQPDAESFSKSIEMALDQEKFFGAFKKADGTWDHLKFAGAIDFFMNRDKYLLEAIKQGKNAAIKATLPDNTQTGMVRQLVTEPTEKSELEQQMERAGIRRAIN